MTRTTRIMDRLRRGTRSWGTIAFAGTLAAVLGWHLAWQQYSSKGWQLELDLNGVRVHSLKVAGTSSKQFRAISKMKGTLRSATAMMLDTTFEGCRDWYPTCMEVAVADRWNPQTLTQSYMYTTRLPFPYAPREALVHIRVSQDAAGGEVKIEFNAAPDKLPQRDCCVRIKNFSSTWRFTPIAGGELEVEVVQLTPNVDMGVSFLLVNQMGPSNLYFTMRKLPRLLNQKKYQNAKLEFIIEPDSLAAPVVATAAL